jgi:uroporphyrinogen decarboxylase
VKPRDVVRDQIDHCETVPVPYTLAFEPDVGARLDEYYGGRAWRERLVPYIVHCGSVCRSANEKLDDAHHRDAFGTVWRTDELPPVVVEAGMRAPTFQGYVFPTADTFLDPTAKAEAARRVAESAGSFTIVSTGMCLWESWYVRGFEETMLDCVAEEDFYAELLDRFTALTLALVGACADIPADAIMMGDDWGDQRGVMLGPERWRKFHKQRYARIFRAIHDQGKRAIMHCCGSVAAIMGDIIEIGLDVLESVQPEAAGMNPYDLKKKWGDRITFWGGLGSQSTIPFAAPAEVRREVQRLRSEMGRGGGYILAPAKPLRPETPTENAVAVVEELLDASGPVRSTGCGTA